MCLILIYNFLKTLKYKSIYRLKVAVHVTLASCRKKSSPGFICIYINYRKIIREVINC